MKITLSSFRGENRALHPLNLPDGVGVVSLNQNPVRGDLRPWNAPLAVATLPTTGYKTIYRMGRDIISDAQYWLSWTKVVHAVRGSTADDVTERTFYSGDGVPQWTDNTIGLGAVMPLASRTLGVPAPAAACVLGASGGASTTTELRYYVYTYVSDRGEEGAPSPLSVALTCKPDATVSISNLVGPSGNYDINRIRIYRTQSGSDGSAEFFFLRELGTSTTVGAGSFVRGLRYTIVSAGTTDFTTLGALDSVVGTAFTATGAGTGTGTASRTAFSTAPTTDDNRTLGEVMPSTTWLMPPADLSCLTGLWNGIMAGITGNAVRFCEAYKPYAWPLAYEVMPPDAKPVALGKFGQNLLVLTTGRPQLVTGSSPDAMDSQSLEIAEACVSARSVVSFGHGVAWACPDGLAYYGSGGAKMITSGLMTREDWQAIKPETIVGGVYEGAYLGFYTVNGVTKGFLVDPLNPTGLYFTDIPGAALFFDDLQDQLYILDGTSIKKWHPATGTAAAVHFKSKLFRTPKPTGFACAEVVADTYPVGFSLYADGVLRHTQGVTNANPFRLPSSFTAQTWQIELTSTSAIQGVALAQSMKELGE